MIELTQHIEHLLLENDCVIIPGFGGFVAYSNHAKRVENENLFLPPTRAIGFNSKLQLNDGLLAQSYMLKHDISFADAMRRVEKEVDALTEALQEKGKVEFANIGELHYTIEQNYEFTPYNEKLTTPWLYGLGSFEMKELSAIRRIEPILQPKETQESPKRYHLHINRAFVRNTVAAVAAIALFFFLSTPIENTYVMKGSYANLLPTDLFETIESKSVITTPIPVDANQQQKRADDKTKKQKAAVKPVAVKEVKVAPKEATTSNVVAATSTSTTATQAITTAPAQPAASVAKASNNKFHLIVLSSVGEEKAQALVTRLKSEGYKDAQILSSNGKVRVSITSYPTHEDASSGLAKLRTNEAFRDAWLLIL